MFLCRTDLILHSAFTHHFLICFQSNLEDVALLSLGQEEEHGLGLVGG